MIGVLEHRKDRPFPTSKSLPLLLGDHYKCGSRDGEEVKLNWEDVLSRVVIANM